MKFGDIAISIDCDELQGISRTFSLTADDLLRFHDDCYDNELEFIVAALRDLADGLENSINKKAH